MHQNSRSLRCRHLRPEGRLRNRSLTGRAQASTKRTGSRAAGSRSAVVDFLFVRVAQLRFDDIEAALERTRAAVLGQRLLPED